MVEEKYFKGTKELLEDAYSECVFEGTDFSMQNFYRKKFSNCRFYRCNLSGIKVENVRLQEVVFLESKIMGVDFTLCDPSFIKLKFEKCLLRGCNFTEMTLKGSAFIDCGVKECHFVQCNLEKGSFFKSNLEGSLFHQTNLKEVNFLEATHYEIDPINNKLAKAKFSIPEALTLLKGLGIVLE